MSVRKKTVLQRSRLAAALVAALFVPVISTAVAQEAQDEDEDSTTSQSQTATLDKVTVTGSRIKRAEVEGPAPVTVITAAEIEREGFATVYDALARSPRTPRRSRTN